MDKEALIDDLVSPEHVLDQEIGDIKTSQEVVDYLSKLKEDDPKKFESMKEKFLQKAEEEGWTIPGS